MAQMRPPEEVLYAFGQWLQQWAEYALSQAEQFAATNPADQGAGTNAPGEQAISQKHRPPAHWLELLPSGPPAQWLALFEEYGLEPPKTDASQDDMYADSPTPEPAPRPLQDWLGEFQRGLAQFTQPPVALPFDQHPVELESAAPNRPQWLPGDDHFADHVSPLHGQGKVVSARPGVNLASQASGVEAEQTAPADSTPEIDLPEQGAAGLERSVLNQTQRVAGNDLVEEHTPPSAMQAGVVHERQGVRGGSQRSEEQGEPDAHAAPSSQTRPRDPSITAQMAERPTAEQPSQIDGLVADRALPEPSLAERAGDRFPPTSSPPGVDFHADRPLSSTVPERIEGIAESRPLPQVFSTKPRTHFPPPPVQEQASQVTDLVTETRTDPDHVPAKSPPHGGEPARPVPVRLRLNPRPPVAIPVPAHAPLPDAEESARPAHIEPSQAELPRLFIGVSAPVGKSPVGPAPLIESAGEFRADEPDLSLGTLADAEKTLPWQKSADSNLVPETYLDQGPSYIGRWNESIPVQREPTPLKWPTPAAANWPELPERLPPVRPPSNVLADSAHRMRINREQRGRSWNM